MWRFPFLLRWASLRSSRAARLKEAPSSGTKETGPRAA